MCGRNCKNCGCRSNFNNCCCNYRGCDFIWPMMFWILRDCNRYCRCGWVNRYDLYR